jgi:hypothetical protein
MLDPTDPIVIEIRSRLGDYDATHPNATRLGTVLQRLTALRDGDPGHADLPEIVTKLTAVAGAVADVATHDELAAVLAAVAGQPTATVDVPALATALLAALPVDLAKQVADELHKRLES